MSDSAPRVACCSETDSHKTSIWGGPRVVVGGFLGRIPWTYFLDVFPSAKCSQSIPLNEGEDFTLAMGGSDFARGWERSGVCDGAQRQQATGGGV